MHYNTFCCVLGSVPDQKEENITPPSEITITDVIGKKRHTIKPRPMGISGDLYQNRRGHSFCFRKTSRMLICHLKDLFSSIQSALKNQYPVKFMINTQV